MRRYSIFLIFIVIIISSFPSAGYSARNQEPLSVYEEALSVMEEAQTCIDVLSALKKYREAISKLEEIKEEFSDWDSIYMVEQVLDECNKGIEDLGFRKVFVALEKDLGQRKERRIVKEASPVIEQEETWVELARKEAQKRRQEAGRIVQKHIEKKGPFKMSGKVSLRYENDWGNGYEDQKLSEYLLLKADDIVPGYVSAYLHMRSEQDIDGGNGSSTYSSARNRVYSAYVDLKKLPLNLGLRGGRQYFPEVESIHFDGLRLNWSNNGKGEVAVFGGKPVTYYGTRYADMLKGGMIRWIPARTTNIMAYYLNVKNGREDNGGGINIIHRIGRSFNLVSRSTFLNGEYKDFSAVMRYNYFKHRISLNAAYYRQILEIDIADGDYSPYILSLGSYVPFHHISLNLNKSFGDSLRIGAGSLFRRPLDSADEAQKNMKFNKYFGNISYSDFLWKGLTPSITFSHWDNLFSDRNSLSGILTQEFGKRFEISLGTFFSNYYYSFYTREERTETRTYFFKIDYDIIKNWDVSFDFSRQESSNYADPSYSSEVRVNWRF